MTLADLEFAVEQGFPGMVEAALAQRGEAEISVSAEGRQLLEKACVLPSTEVVTLLLGVRGYRAPHVSKKLATELFAAATRAGRTGAMAALLALGPDRGGVDPEYLGSALGDACQSRNEAAVALLLGLEGERRNKVLSGSTAAIKAMCEGGTEAWRVRMAATLLRQRRADGKWAYRLRREISGEWTVSGMAPTENELLAEATKTVGCERLVEAGVVMWGM
jgi:hypothetical protein